MQTLKRRDFYFFVFIFLEMCKWWGSSEQNPLMVLYFNQKSTVLTVKLVHHLGFDHFSWYSQIPRHLHISPVNSPIYIKKFIQIKKDICIVGWSLEDSWVSSTLVICCYFFHIFRYSTYYYNLILFKDRAVTQHIKSM